MGQRQALLISPFAPLGSFDPVTDLSKLAVVHLIGLLECVRQKNSFASSLQMLSTDSEGHVR